MLKIIVVAALAFCTAGQTSLCAQTGHRHDTASFYLRTTDAVARQIGAGHSFSPTCNRYLPAAVRRFGITGGILSTSDRINRSGRIGMAGLNSAFIDPSDHLLHEGFEAYSFKRVIPDNIFPSVISVPSIKPGRENAGRDWDFINYLLQSGLKRDAETILFQNGRYAPSDTLSYLRGMTAYDLQNYEAAAYYMSRVDASSPLSDPAFFHFTASLIELGYHRQAEHRLNSYSGVSTDLKFLQLEAVSLLKDDSAGYLKHSAAAGQNASYAVTQAGQALAQIYRDRTDAKARKPWVAATASAIVPGLGKLYAGDLAEGIASFLVVGSFGAVTAECIVKEGFGDWRSILFGTVGSILYLGNIYGSYFSVERINTYNHEAQKQAIMYNIHLPLRSVFR